MKIRKIHIENILSYGNETIEFNNDLNIIVGSNGSGKSNLMNIIIYLIKRFCFRNFEISTVYGPERIGTKRYSIRQKNPLYNSSEDFFLQKHKTKETENSSILLSIVFEESDLENLYEIKRKEKTICNFLDNSLDNIGFLEDKYQIDKNEIKKIFSIDKDDLHIGEELVLEIYDTNEGWKVQNSTKEYYTYMKFFSLILDILNLIGVKHNIKNPFIFFEAYRNNSSETTKVAITEFDNQGYINMQSWENLLSLNYAIGTNSTYIMLATKKYGKIMRKAIEQEGGLSSFHNSSDYKRLKSFFSKFEYDINLKCISPENNIYQFYLVKDGLEIEIDTVSSGEREIINFIFGLFLEELRDAIVIIDEPELHLHPNWQKKLIQILKEETQNKNIQIFFVTHSSSFIAYNTLNNIYRIYQQNGFSKCIRINHLLQDDDANNIRKNLSVVNATNNEKIFFADNVILVEGITDEILFKKIYEDEFGTIPDGLEFVSIAGKSNFDNFRNILDKLNINCFFIGDYDNIYSYTEVNYLFSVDEQSQNKDLKKTKNQSYAALDLLKALGQYIRNQNETNLDFLIENYNLYNERFIKTKADISEDEKKQIYDFIEKKYNENIYILKEGEIEDYLQTGNRNKSVGFRKVISFLEDSEQYNNFKESKHFKELRYIIYDIHEKLEKRI